MISEALKTINDSVSNIAGAILEDCKGSQAGLDDINQLINISFAHFVGTPDFDMAVRLGNKLKEKCNLISKVYQDVPEEHLIEILGGLAFLSSQGVDITELGL